MDTKIRKFQRPLNFKESLWGSWTWWLDNDGDRRYIPLAMPKGWKKRRVAHVWRRLGYN